ncbi:hypothetical protein PFISCL1PPCAC_26645, partial [Pristionchus fissidentatus]
CSSTYPLTESGEYVVMGQDENDQYAIERKRRMWREKREKLRKWRYEHKELLCYETMDALTKLWDIDAKTRHNLLLWACSQLDRFNTSANHQQLASVEFDVDEFTIELPSVIYVIILSDPLFTNALEENDDGTSRLIHRVAGCKFEAIVDSNSDESDEYYTCTIRRRSK